MKLCLLAAPVPTLLTLLCSRYSLSNPDSRDTLGTRIDPLLVCFLRTLGAYSLVYSSNSPSATAKGKTDIVSTFNFV